VCVAVPYPPSDKDQLLVPLAYLMVFCVVKRMNGWMDGSCDAFWSDCLVQCAPLTSPPLPPFSPPACLAAWLRSVWLLAFSWSRSVRLAGGRMGVCVGCCVLQ